MSDAPIPRPEADRFGRIGRVTSITVVIAVTFLTAAAPVVAGVAAGTGAGVGPPTGPAGSDPGAAVTSAAVTAQAGAVNLTGRVVTDEGTPSVNRHIEARGIEGTESLGAAARTDEEGRFALGVQPGTYALEFEQFDPETEGIDPPRDGVPDVYALGRIEAVESADVGTFELPAAHPLSVTVVDGNGDPVANASVHVRTFANGVAASLPLARTNADGAMTYPGAGEPGVEVVGPVEIDVQPPPGSDFSHAHRELEVTGPRLITISLQETVDVRGRIVEADGDAAANDFVGVTGDDGTEGGDGAFTDERGAFTARVPTGGTYVVGYRQDDPETDGVFEGPIDGSPDLYAVDRLADLRDDTDLGAVELPDAHTLEVAVVGPDGTPVRGATVHVAHVRNDARAHLQGRTDADGLLGLPGRAATGVEVVGRVRIEAVPPEGSALRAAGTALEVTDDRRVTVALERRAAVTGRIVESDGDPGAAAIVVGYRTDGPEGGDKEKTDEAGRFSLDIAEGGTYGVGYRQDDPETVDVIEAPRDGSPDVYAIGRFADVSADTDLGDVRLPDAHVLNVRVVDEAGDPVEGARIHLVHERDNAHFDTGGRTGPDGRFHLRGHEEPGVEVVGTVELRVVPPDGSRLTENDTELEVTGQRSLTITLARQGTVTGRIVQADGDPAANHRVEVVGIDGTRAHDGVRTDAEGAFTAHVPDGGTYAVGYHQDDPRTDAVFEAPRDGSPDVFAFGRRITLTDTAEIGPMQLPDAHPLDVRVVDGDGTPIEGARVRVIHIRRNAEFGLRGRTGRDGRFRLRGHDEPGVEVTGHVKVIVEPPPGSGLTENGTELDVTGPASVTIGMQERVRVSGRLLGADGDPAARDTIHLDGREGTPLHAGQGNVTDTAGRFVTSGVRGGTFDVEYIQDDPSSEADVGFPTDGTPDVYAVTRLRDVTADADIGEIRLPEAHRLEVRVVDHRGNPVEGATVNVGHEARATGARAWADAPTNAEGLLAHPQGDDTGIEVVGSIEVHVEPPEGSDLSENGTQVTMTEDASLTIVLDSVVPVRGRLLEPDGTPASRYTVHVHGRAGTDDAEGDITDEQGRFEARVRPGTYNVHVHQADFSRETGLRFPDDDTPDIYGIAQIRVGPNGTDVGTIGLPAAHDVQIRVVDPDGAPVEGATVRVFHNPPFGAAGGPDANLAPEGAPTNARGLLVAPGRDAPGLDLVGDIAVRAIPPEGSGLQVNDTAFTVTGPRTVTVSLPAETSIEGRVLSSDGAPTVNATIEIEPIDRDGGRNPTTDAEGRFAATVRAGDTYDVRFHQGGETRRSDGVPDLYAIARRTASGTVNLRTTTLPEASELDVRVIDGAGRPVGNATVHLEHRNGEASAFATARTNAAGRLVLDGRVGIDAAGRMEIGVEPPAGSDLSENGTRVMVTDDTTVTIVLHPQAPVRGRLLQPDGAPASRHTVHVHGRNGTDDDGGDITDEQGRFEASVRPGTYNVHVHQADFSRETGLRFPDDDTPDIYGIAHLTVGGNGTDLGTVELPAAHDVQIRVVDESGAPVENATVRVFQNPPFGAAGGPDANLAPEGAPTNARGLLEVPGREGPGLDLVGDIGVRAFPPEGSRFQENLTGFSVAGPKTVRVVLSSPATVSGRVLEPDGAPAAAEKIRLNPRGTDRIDRTWTDGEGRFTGTTLPDATVDVAFYQVAGDGEFEPTSPRDGIPDLYLIERVSTADDVDFGTVNLPRASLLEVTVVDASGAPVANATVDVNHVKGEAWAHARGRTNEDGELVLGETVGVEVTGTVDVFAEPPPGSPLAENGTRVQVDGDRHLRLVVRRQVTVSGRLRTAAGDPASLDFVGAFPELVERARSGDFTDESGTFSFRMDRGRPATLVYVQHATRDRPTPRDGLVDVWPLQELDASGDVDLGTIDLPRGHPVNLTVVDESGRPVEDARVKIVTRNGETGASSVSPTFRTREDGKFYREETGIAGFELAGNLTFRIRPPEGDDTFVDQPYRRNVTVTGETSLQVTLEDRSGNVDVSGRLLKTNGDPAANDSVSAIGERESGSSPIPSLFVGRTVASGPTNGSGAFSFRLSSGAPVTLVYTQWDRTNAPGPVGPTRVGPVDGSVDIWPLRTTDRTADVRLGTIKLPPGHVVNVSVVDGSGAAVSSARLRFRVQNPITGATQTVRATTDRNGTKRYELAGNVTITVRPPTRSERFPDTPVTRRISVTENETVRITLESGVAVGRAIAGEDRRVGISDLQRAIQLWATGEAVPGTGGQTISTPKLRELIQLWVTQAPVSE